MVQQIFDVSLFVHIIEF